MPQVDPAISIVVCTYNRAGLLAECLTSLTEQTADPALFEVIIVDNNSHDDTEVVCSSFTERNRNFRYIHEARQGLSHARNSGAREANSPWICYIDDDAKAFRNYAERIMHVIQHYDFDCFGGIYHPWYKYGKPKWYKDSYGSKPLERDDIGTLTSGYLSGGVMIVKKAVLESLGGFSPEIGMSGESISYGEEVLLQVRMRKSGMSIGFDPELQIYHLVNAHKLTMLWFLKSAYANGLDDWDTFDKKVTWFEFAKILPRNLVYFAEASIRNTPLLFRGDYYFQNWVIECLSPVARSFGQIVSGARCLIGDSARRRIR
ncbi:MAG: glycosyltransferase family 2 protein [Thiogranum sp.]|nr:glycosyltransferase family 2 protein [Thiogranum sp.]